MLSVFISIKEAISTVLIMCELIKPSLYIPAILMLVLFIRYNYYTYTRIDVNSYHFFDIPFDVKIINNTWCKSYSVKIKIAWFLLAFFILWSCTNYCVYFNVLILCVIFRYNLLQSIVVALNQNGLWKMSLFYLFELLKIMFGISSESFFDIVAKEMKPFADMIDNMDSIIDIIEKIP